MNLGFVGRATLVTIVATAHFACSSDDKAEKGGAGGATGTEAGSGGTQSTEAGSGGAAVGGTDGGAAVRTSAACGSLPVLGDYGAATPTDCATCVESSCCTEAKACAADTNCAAFRECAVSCAPLDGNCRTVCAGLNAPGAANGAFSGCRNQKCSACVDVACVGDAFPAPTAKKQSVQWFLFNFVTGAGVSGLSVKVCDKADVDCASPLDQGTTDSGGNVTVDMPTAPKWTSAYLEVTGTAIQSQLSFPNGRGALPASGGFPVLDKATAAAFLKLAGQSPAPDGGTLDAGALTTGTIGIQAQTCENGVLPGATVTSSKGGPDAVTSYITGGLPSTAAKMTSTAGQAGIVNHPSGPTTVSMQLAGKTLGSVDVLVRAGWYTTCSIPPGP